MSAVCAALGVLVVSVVDATIEDGAMRSCKQSIDGRKRRLERMEDLLRDKDEIPKKSGFT